MRRHSLLSEPSQKKMASKNESWDEADITRIMVISALPEAVPEGRYVCSGLCQF
jgi:hypothetical protein